MKCVFINCFPSSNEMRVEPIRDFFKKKGYETFYFGSDFHHAKKEYVQLPKDITPIHVRGYKNNLSIQRILSHHEFAIEVGKRIETLNPDVIYVKFPPNSLVKAVYKYKQTHNCKVILDIFDLWPEALPISQNIKRIITPITNVWKGLRDNYLTVADVIFTECDMYQEVLKDTISNVKVQTIYPYKNDINNFKIIPNDGRTINVCYLGGINKLIDINAVKAVLIEMCKYKEVVFHIIGDGDNKERLIKSIKALNIQILDHGIIYNDDQKQEIMSICDFGLNLMKDTTKVALSLKSIEYFRSGLAVINNLPYDTWRLIDSEGAGINWESISHNEENKKLLLTPAVISLLRNNSRRVYEKFFSENEMYFSLEQALRDF